MQGSRGDGRVDGWCSLLGQTGNRCIAQKGTRDAEVSAISPVPDVKRYEGKSDTLSDSFALNSTKAACMSPSPILPIPLPNRL